MGWPNVWKTQMMGVRGVSGRCRNIGGGVGRRPVRALLHLFRNGEEWPSTPISFKLMRAFGKKSLATSKKMNLVFSVTNPKLHHVYAVVPSHLVIPPNVHGANSIQKTRKCRVCHWQNGLGLDAEESKPLQPLWQTRHVQAFFTTQN